MKQILKRLELIKTSIEINEEEIIELQVLKLKKLQVDNTVKLILKKIDRLDYNSVIADIEEYLEYLSDINKEVETLKIEVKSLEEEIHKLSQDKTEYISYIDKFNTQHNLHLGKTIKNILNLKKEILYKQTIKQQNLKEKYQKDITTYQDTKENLFKTKDTIIQFEKLLKNIDEENENYNEIYKTYKELEAEINKLEIKLSSQEEQLNDTREQLENDELLKEYEKIKVKYEEYYNQYQDIYIIENGNEFDIKNEISEDKESLKSQILKLKQIIVNLEDEIKNIKEDSTYILINKIINWDEYFEELKDELKTEEKILTKELDSLIQVVQPNSILRNRRKKKSISTNIKENMILGLNTINSGIKTFRDTLEITNNALEEAVEESKVDLYKTKINGVKKYYELGFSNNEIAKVVDLDFDTIGNITNDMLTEIESSDDWIESIFQWANENNISNEILKRDKKELINIKELDLSELELTNLPNEIINLKKLEKLDLSFNNISKLPFNIISLKKLKLEFNQLHKLPEEIIHLDKLELLQLHGNNLQLTSQQKEWIEELKSKGTKITIDFCDHKNQLYLFKDILAEEQTSNKTLHAIWLDPDTSLMWQVDIDYNRYNWDEAFRYVEKLNKENYGGYNDWTLPSIETLQTIINKEKRKNTNGNSYCINEKLLESMKGTDENSIFWSKSEESFDNKMALAAYFYSGLIREEDKSFYKYVRCVRGKNLNNSIETYSCFDNDSELFENIQTTSDYVEPIEIESTNIYLSTTVIARKHNIEAKPDLFNELINLKLLYKDDKSYKLTSEGMNIGGKYEKNENGNQWVVWEENSLTTIIDNLKRKPDLVPNKSKDKPKTLTSHQNRVFNDIIRKINVIFNNNQCDNRISLSGSAGVGKTFLTIEIIKHLKENNFGITVTTPTHKALSVITDNLRKYNIKDIESKTLHSFLELELKIDENTGEKIFVIDEKNIDKNKTGILIVDESSMIGDDLFHFINKAIKEKRITLVLFVGDHYQLPPVNSEKNTIFELTNSYKLDEIVRQAKDSYIIKIATKIRDCIIKKDFSYRIEDFFIGNYDSLKIFTHEEKFLNDFFKNDSKAWYEKNQIIADYINKSVDRYNEISRRRYWLDKGVTNPKQIVKDDIVVFQEAVLDGDKVIFQNGSTTKIKSCVESYDEKLDLFFWLCKDYDEKEFKIIDNRSKDKYFSMLKDIIEKAQNATNGYEKMNNWKSYYGLKEEYASIKFNYSSTIHKLQGSTYHTVFIDIRKMVYLFDNNKADKEFLYRLLYVAVTRASNNIRILQ